MLFLPQRQLVFPDGSSSDVTMEVDLQSSPKETVRTLPASTWDPADWCERDREVRLLPQQRLLSLQLTEASLFICRRRSNGRQCSQVGGTFNPFNMTLRVRPRFCSAADTKQQQTSAVPSSFPLRVPPARVKTLWAVRLGRYRRDKEQSAWQKDSFTQTAALTSSGTSQVGTLRCLTNEEGWGHLFCLSSGSQVSGAEGQWRHRRLRRHPAGVPFSRADLPQCDPLQQVSGGRVREESGQGRYQDQSFNTQEMGKRGKSRQEKVIWLILRNDKRFKKGTVV